MWGVISVGGFLLYHLVHFHKLTLAAMIHQHKVLKR